MCYPLRSRRSAGRFFWFVFESTLRIHYGPVNNVFACGGADVRANIPDPISFCPTLSNVDPRTTSQIGIAGGDGVFLRRSFFQYRVGDCLYNFYFHSRSALLLEPNLN